MTHADFNVKDTPFGQMYQVHNWLDHLNLVGTRSLNQYRLKVEQKRKGGIPFDLTAIQIRLILSIAAS